MKFHCSYTIFAMAYRMKSQNYDMSRKYIRIIDNTVMEFSILNAGNWQL